jgi:hypothetical protein
MQENFTLNLLTEDNQKGLDEPKQSVLDFISIFARTYTADGSVKLLTKTGTGLLS